MTVAKPAPQAACKYGVQLKVEPRCKTCTSPYRGSIEDLLYLAKSRIALEALGKPPTIDWISENSKRLFGGLQLSPRNLRTHAATHWAPMSADGQGEGMVTLTDQRQQLLEAIERGEGLDSVSPEQYLASVVAVAYEKLKLAPESVTVNQAISAINAMTARKTQDATMALMEALGRAQARARGTKLSDEVIEAEVVSEIEPPEAA